MLYMKCDFSPAFWPTIKYFLWAPKYCLYIFHKTFMRHKMSQKVASKYVYINFMLLKRKTCMILFISIEYYIFLYSLLFSSSCDDNHSLLFVIIGPRLYVTHHPKVFLCVFLMPFFSRGLLTFQCRLLGLFDDPSWHFCVNYSDDSMIQVGISV